MRFLAELLGAVFPEYQYTWLFPEFEESIGLELGTEIVPCTHLRRPRAIVSSCLHYCTTRSCVDAFSPFANDARVYTRTWMGPVRSR